MIEQAISFVRKQIPNFRRHPPLTAMAEEIVIAQDDSQLRLLGVAEPALLDACKMIIELDTIARRLNRAGVPCDIRRELRWITRKMREARIYAAYSIYVEMPKTAERAFA